MSLNLTADYLNKIINEVIPMTEIDDIIAVLKDEAPDKFNSLLEEAHRTNMPMGLFGMKLMNLWVMCKEEGLI